MKCNGRELARTARAMLMVLVSGVGIGIGGCADKKPRPMDEMAMMTDLPTWQPFGLSVDGRELHALTVGTGATRVLVIGGIHGDEREALPSVPHLVELLAEEPAASAARWRVIRDLNPDGTTFFRRTNSNQVDLNRNFPARNFDTSRRARKRVGEEPLSEPETRAMVKMVEHFDPSVIIVFHSSRQGPFVNFDGPASELAAAFAAGASGVDARWRIVPQMSYATPGSLGSYYGEDLGVPVLTIEFEREQSARDAWYAIDAGFREMVSRGVLRSIGDQDRSETASVAGDGGAATGAGG
jgi:predicted deacylase